jgi:hypothetical protein
MLCSISPRARRTPHLNLSGGARSTPAGNCFVWIIYGVETGTPMIRIWIMGSALALALAMPAAAQPRSVTNALERLHTLCDQNYKPACIRLGVYIAKLPSGAARSLRRDHPEWWWWERW